MSSTSIRYLKILLPIAGCILILVFLVTLVSPELSRFMAYQQRANEVKAQEEGEDTSSESHTITGRTASSHNYRNGNGVSFSSADGFALPQKAQKKGENIMEEDLEGERNYMPLIIAQTSNNKQRRLSKAERKRIEERRDRQENWVYADPDEVVEEANKDIWKKDGTSSQKMGEDEESDTVESIVLGDKKNLLIYRFINGNSKQNDNSDTESSSDTRTAQTKRTTDNTASTTSSSREKLQSYGTSSIQNNEVFVSSSANIFSSGVGNNLLNSSPSFMQSGFNNQKLFENFADVTPQTSKSMLANQQSMSDFRSMISSGGKKDSLLGNQVTISRSTDSLFGGSDNQNALSPSSFSLPTTSLGENPTSLTLTTGPSAKEIAPTTRGIQRDALGSPSIPRFTIKR